MPELAEVLFLSHGWDAALGQVVEEVLIHPKARVFRAEPHPDRFCRRLKGRTYEGASTHGKQMLFSFGPGLWLWGHLGMTGELKMLPEGEEPGRHDHAAFLSKSQWFVFRDPRMFGSLCLVESQVIPEEWQNLPPEILSDEFTVELVARAMRQHGKLTSKAFLLLQQWFPGVGNWMADEVLWRCGVHPSKKVGEWEPGGADLLWRELRKLVKEAVKTIGVDWRDPPGDWLFRHRWDTGFPCPRCGTVLQRSHLGGRTTCWCPLCQPGEDKIGARKVGSGRRRESPNQKGGGSETR